MNEHIAHSRDWGIALIMIEVASWKERARTDMIRAFIIALYMDDIRAHEPLPHLNISI